MAKAKKTELPTTSTTSTETIVDTESKENIDNESTPLDVTKSENEETDIEVIVDSELQPKVKTLSGKFYKHEMEYIDKVLEARQTTVYKGKPLTRDVNHFIRQCVRFTINHRDNAKFWLPDIAETLIDT